MTFEVDITVLKDEKHISVRTAWIDAENVSECQALAKEVAEDIDAPEDAICLHIEELEQWDPLQEER